MILVIERAAAVREPAHDDAIAGDDLLAVNAEVLTLFARAARYGEAPGDERPCVARPARLHRQLAEIHVLCLVDDLLAGRAGALLWRHVEHALEHRKLVPEIAQAARRLGLLQIGEELADFAQLRGVARPHGGCD